MILKSFLTVCVGMLLVGCSLNEGSSEVDSSSETLQSSSNIALPSSSSRTQEPDTEFRNLNVTVDYLHDSAWVDTLIRYITYGQIEKIDTTVLERIYGDTLQFYRISYKGWGSGQKFSGVESYECYLSLGKCNLEDSSAKQGFEGLMFHLRAGNARSSEALWNLAVSDSAIIWSESLGASPDTNFSAIPGALSYKNVKYSYGQMLSTSVTGYQIIVHAIPKPDIHNRSGLPNDATKLLISLDYTKDSLWVRECSVSSGMSRQISKDTIRVLKVTPDSILLLRHRYSGSSK